MIFLVAAVSFLAKNITSSLIVESFIDRYLLIVSTDDFVTFSIFNFNPSSLYFRLDAWTMETRDIKQ